MLIHLQRSFSTYNESHTNDEEDWDAFFLGQRKGQRTWNDLHAVPLSIVLGEAGIGKTVEFKLEADRLIARGEAAFFLALNQLSDSDSWNLALTGRDDEYRDWVASDKVGHFFFDAVDEARLKSHSDFEKALLVVQRTLGAHFSRVRITISSRVTDWSSLSVQKAVDLCIASPIARAIAAKAAADGLSDEKIQAPTVALPTPAVSVVKAFVVGLDPLSTAEAHRCATAFGLQDEAQFWQAVSDGDYEFMASRPLDLRWMVELWNRRRTLGTYRELMDVNVENRLREFNESYEAAGEVLSVDQLRTGAVELAAAAEFGSCAYFVLNPSTLPAEGELGPQTVLTIWEPHEVRRLLATAVFDEASYGRVKFHHRSIREYLAAEWVARQLTLGVPLLRLQELFVGRPYGTPVLIPSRRATLSWLAALSVEVREWVARDLPEIFLASGDQQAWDGLSAEMAFLNCLKASKVGLRPGWRRSASEFMRIGRALPAGKVATALADTTITGEIKALCYQIACYANLTDCVPVALVDYRSPFSLNWERGLALDLLQRVGTTADRQQVLADLKSGALATNELIAHALPMVDWRALTVVELADIFSATQSEAEYGSGPMACVIKDTLLPGTDLASAMLLLQSVMAALPRPISGKRFARFPESDRPDRAWLLDVLPDCYERALELLPSAPTVYSAVCMEAAERIEALRDSGFTDQEEFKRLHAAIASHDELRWDIALAIAHSEDIQASVSRLTWGTHCLVSMGESDLTELTRRANDTTQPQADHDVWQAVAIEVAFRHTHGRTRASALRALGAFTPSSPRSALVGSKYHQWRQGARLNRTWKAEELTRKAEATQRIRDFKADLTANLANIATGTLDGYLRNLLHHSFGLSGRWNYAEGDFQAVATSLGSEIAEAFESGLKAFWPTLTPPNPSDYSDGKVPWTALIALAGLSCSLRSAEAISALAPPDAARASQLAAWNLNGPPDWFAPLAQSHPTIVDASLAPWLLAEAQAASPGNGVRGALEMVLVCNSTVRGGLLAPLVPLVTGGLVARHETLKVLIKAMREDALLSSSTICAMCQAHLSASATTEVDMFWLRIWIEEDTATAWGWLSAHISSLTGPAEAEVTAFARAVGDLKWLKEPLKTVQADVLLEIYSLLGAHPPTATATATDEESTFFGPPSKQLRQAIPNLFVRVRGSLGHQSLLGLLGRCTDPDELKWLNGKVAEHSSLDATMAAKRSVAELRTISSPFLSEPKTEAQLHVQVVARLEEIRKNLEEGPFSERDLFSAGMPEKFLQRWLAAKFRETQNRRFSVHREEEVDDDKKTDIQLSCPAGNVCVEIKPVDSGRYSANTLTDTLRTQIVGQYLKGSNSSRGILVLMQLDDKKWDIPGGLTRQSFSALVDYLAGQATAIRIVSANVNELAVFGMRCIV